jgi:release factor glutamine methyltransferase
MFRNLWQPLTAIYDEGEAKTIVRWVLEVRFGLTWTDIVCGKVEALTPDDQKELATIMQRLTAGEPVQYVVGLAEFGPRLFHVAPGVLIPRPETYELCQWIISSGLQRTNTDCLEKSAIVRCQKILDIGTGSGCIACTLAAEIAEAEVTAWDISEEALVVARENAKRTHIHVSFEQVDVLKRREERGERREDSVFPEKRIEERGYWDLIVSNPPYICEKERATMERNVLDHEPETALFVPDDDPLLFYRAIAQYGQEALKEGGWLYFEINPLYAREMTKMLRTMAYSAIESKEDQYGKTRMIRAKRDKR